MPRQHRVFVTELAPATRCRSRSTPSIFVGQAVGTVAFGFPPTIGAGDADRLRAAVTLTGFVPRGAGQIAATSPGGACQRPKMPIMEASLVSRERAAEIKPIEPVWFIPAEEARMPEHQDAFQTIPHRCHRRKHIDSGVYGREDVRCGAPPAAQSHAAAGMRRPAPAEPGEERLIAPCGASCAARRAEEAPNSGRLRKARCSRPRSMDRARQPSSSSSRRWPSVDGSAAELRRTRAACCRQPRGCSQFSLGGSSGDNRKVASALFATPAGRRKSSRAPGVQRSPCGGRVSLARDGARFAADTVVLRLAPGRVRLRGCRRRRAFRCGRSRAR